MTLRICHSYWSSPALCGRWNVEDQMIQDLWFFALSAHYVKSHGHRLVLHTDALGEHVFGILPYDEVHRTLDDVAASDVFWAAGKIAALRAEALGAVHIDGDVFIKTSEIYDLIETHQCDLLVQGDYRCSSKIVETLRPYLVRFLPILFRADSHLSYSCGVVSFRDQELKDEYTTAYQKLIAYLSRSTTLITLMRQHRDMSLDLVTEQRLLRALAEQSGSTVQRITSEPAAVDDPHVVAEGYEHPAFLSKYQLLPQIQAELRDAAPLLFDRVSEHAKRGLTGYPVPSSINVSRFAGDGSGSGARRALVMSKTDWTRCAIVTPYYQEERRLLERCIDSVRRQTIPADHFLVADGFPQDWLDAAGVRHLRLDRSHGDCGNTPRGIGALLAVAEEYGAIGMLDADNWLEPNHIELCLAAAATTATPCDYVIARRIFRRPDESEIDIREEAGHVDTSCFFFLRGAFCVVPHWATQPRDMSLECDRVFYAMLRERNFVGARTAQPTVNFQSLFTAHYRQLGEAPPPGAKHTNVGEAQAWLAALPQREREVARRLVGYVSPVDAVPQSRRVPWISAALPVV